MDFFKLKKFRNSQKPNAKDVGQDQPEEPKNTSTDLLPRGKSVNLDPADNAGTEEDDDDDFILNEVKRRLKELRRNSFMVLIPEESSPPAGEEEEDEEEGETSSSTEWRDVEAEGRQFWSGFDAVYDVYCDRMLTFDRLSTQQLLEVGCHVPSTPSPRPVSKKLGSPFGCLSLRKFEGPEEEIEHLQQPMNDPYQDLETSYVGQVCLTWEALHCQYTQLSQKIASQPESPTASYNHSAQQFQQFQVLLQRFIENEPFETGSRPEIYARTRKSLIKLLQVPKIQASEEKRRGGEEASDFVVLTTDLIRVIESSILSFHQFIKTDKKKSGVRNVFGSQNQMFIPAQHVQSSLEKKEVKLKELWKKSKSYKKKSWPTTAEDVEMLLALVDIKLLSRVLRMSRISKEQLLWCEEKMKKLCLNNGKLLRDPSPILFP
ncbi:hypothetical protein STAS_31204 [Striga asiatica]|uniref:Uncharacterized protein n=1 Tax=Striga asiatica TaxID=4170 RepID=A0A5A7RAP3_STRAF|nr:hypothetical protein STAS_31204 [Striga asiatica]